MRPRRLSGSLLERLRLSSAFQRINEHPGPQSAFPESPSFSRLIQCLMPPLSHFVSFRPTPCSKERLSRRLLQNTPEIRSEEQTSELQSIMRIPYAVFCLNKKKTKQYYNFIRKHNTKKTKLENYNDLSLNTESYYQTNTYGAKIYYAHNRILLTNDNITKKSHKTTPNVL